MGPRTILDAMVKRKIPSPRREWNPRTTTVQPVAIPTELSRFLPLLSRDTYSLTIEQTNSLLFEILLTFGAPSARLQNPYCDSSSNVIALPSCFVNKGVVLSQSLVHLPTHIFAAVQERYPQSWGYNRNFPPFLNDSGDYPASYLTRTGVFTTE
jgi:hypothetical protein